MIDLYEQYVRLLDDLRRRYDYLFNFLVFGDPRLQLLRSEIYEIKQDIKKMREFVSC